MPCTKRISSSFGQFYYNRVGRSQIHRAHGKSALYATMRPLLSPTKYTYTSNALFVDILWMLFRSISDWHLALIQLRIRPVYVFFVCLSAWLCICVYCVSVCLRRQASFNYEWWTYLLLLWFSTIFVWFFFSFMFFYINVWVCLTWAQFISNFIVMLRYFLKKKDRKKTKMPHQSLIEFVRARRRPIFQHVCGLNSQL